MEIINWPEYSSWEQRVILSNREYDISMAYNSRDESWYLSLVFDNQEILRGKRVLIDTDLLYGVNDVNRPQGLLYATSMTDGVEELNRDNVGSDIELIYVGFDEIL